MAVGDGVDDSWCRLMDTENIDVMRQEDKAKCSQPRRRADHCIEEQVVSRRMDPMSTADKAPGPNQLRCYAVPGQAMLDCPPVLSRVDTTPAILVNILFQFLSVLCVTAVSLYCIGFICITHSFIFCISYFFYPITPTHQTIKRCAQNIASNKTLSHVLILVSNMEHSEV